VVEQSGVQGWELISVNGTVYTAEVLRKAIVAAERDTKPISLVFQRGDQVETIPLDCHGGLRYPSLQRVEGTPARFDDILAPSKSPLPAN
jgi:hypothetical protein